jgi:hypothetical protein
VTTDSVSHDTRAGHTVRIVLQCRQAPEFSTCGETIGWTKKFGSAAISPHFPNEEIERFTCSRGGVIPYRILVGLDVVTREMEEQAQLDAKEVTVEEIRQAEQVLDAAQKERQAAGQAKEEARRLWEAAQANQQAAERAEAEARGLLNKLIRQRFRRQPRPGQIL